MAKHGMLGYENKVIENFFIDEDQEIEHKYPFGCGWKGKIKDCEESELGPRCFDGYEYRCPKCHRVIHVHRLMYYD